MVGEGSDRGGVSEHNDGHTMSELTWNTALVLLTFLMNISSILSTVRKGGVSGADYSKMHAYPDGNIDTK